MLALLTGTLAFVAPALVSPAAAAPGDPFDARDPYAFVAQQVPTRLYKSITGADGSVTFEPEGPAAAMQYNAIAYNTADNYLYGISLSDGGGIPANSLIRIGQDGVVTRVGANTFDAANVGVFAPDGFLYVTGSGSTTVTRINVATGTAVGTVTLSQSMAAAGGGADLAYADGFLWTLGDDVIARVDLGTGAVTSWTLPFDTDFAGASWTFGNGNLGFSANVTGAVYQIDVTNAGAANPTFTLVAQSPGPASGNNDGAASPGLPTDYAITKAVQPTFQPGQQVTYTMTVTNDGPGNSSGYTVTDELPAGLLSPQTSSPGCSVTGRTLTCVGGRLLVGESVTVTVTGGTAVTQATCLSNSASVLANETDPLATNDTASATTCPRILRIDKTSDATQATRVGDTVAYTVTARSVGPGDFTAATPASFEDDLSGVLDDGTYQGDASATRGTVSYAEPLLSWSGPLASGESVTVTYTVKLDKNGDQRVANGVYQCPQDGDCSPPQQCVDGVDPDTGLACDREELDLPHLAIEKAAPELALAEVGDTVTYTVTATNDGRAPYTEADPARLLDSLTGVLDDAVYNADVAADKPGTVSYAEPTLQWAGPLAVGESVVVTYTATLTGRGDHRLTNVAFEPPPCPEGGIDCEPPPPPPCPPRGIDPDTGLAVDCVVEPVPHLTVDKTGPDLSTVRVGDTVTYTVTATNDGEADYTVERPADVADDLTGVLDDGSYQGDATSSRGDAPTFLSPQLRWSGALPMGESVTITYTVKLTKDGDQNVRNLAIECNPKLSDCERPKECVDGSDPLTGLACDAVELGLPHLSIKKSAPRLATATIGDTVTYRVTATNDGKADYTTDKPARVVDNLTGVLDDATYNRDAAASLPGRISFAAPNLQWVGPLPVGESVTMTYTVTLTGRGDLQVENLAFEPPSCDALDRGPVARRAGTGVDCPPPPPPPCPPAGVDAQTGLSVDCVANLLPRLGIVKTSPDLAQAELGDTVHYTVTATNVGKGDYTTERPALVVDDLTLVLDDASYQGDASASRGAVPVFTGSQLRWSGAIPAGESVRITYSVTLDRAGDGSVDNLAFECNPRQNLACPPPERCGDGQDTDTGLPCAVLGTQIERPPLPDTGSGVSFALLPGALGLFGLGSLGVWLARRRSSLLPTDRS